MPTLRIDGLRTMNQHGIDATLFDPFSDALSLTMDLYASADLIALPSASLLAEFQILDPHTHQVVVSQVRDWSYSWGEWFWISLGNNWGPPASYQTPYAWGLVWNVNSVFGFRGIVRAYDIPFPGAGLESLDAFDVSGMRWFRVKEEFLL